MLCWLEVAELRIAEEFLVGGDLDKVKQQLLELKVSSRAPEEEALQRQASTTNKPQGKWAHCTPHLVGAQQGHFKRSPSTHPLARDANLAPSGHNGVDGF